jgi:hypothetical protein
MAKTERQDIPWLHLHPGAYWHDDAAIIGTRGALLALRDAVDRALQHWNAVEEMFVNDGEGYVLYVHVLNEEDMRKMALPYTDEMAMERDSGATRPHQLQDRAERQYREKFIESRPSETK